MASTLSCNMERKKQKHKKSIRGDIKKTVLTVSQTITMLKLVKVKQY